MDNGGEPWWASLVAVLVSVSVGTWLGAWLTWQYGARQSSNDRAWGLADDLVSAETDFAATLRDYTAARMTASAAGIPVVDALHTPLDRLIAVLGKARHGYSNRAALDAVERELRMGFGEAVTVGWALGQSQRDVSQRERKRAQIMADYESLRPRVQAIADAIAGSVKPAEPALLLPRRRRDARAARGAGRGR